MPGSGYLAPFASREVFDTFNMVSFEWKNLIIRFFYFFPIR